MDETEKYAELRKLAEAATPGPWESDDTTVSQHWSRPEPWLDVVNDEIACMAYCYGGSVRPIERPEDAAYIAAANPTAVLELLDRLEAAETALERTRTLVADGGDYHYAAVDDSEGEYVMRWSSCVSVDDLLAAIGEGVVE